MLQPGENSERTIGYAIADAFRYAEDGRPRLGLLVLRQALDLAQWEQGAGRAWAAAAVARVEAEIRRSRAEYQGAEL